MSAKKRLGGQEGHLKHVARGPPMGCLQAVCLLALRASSTKHLQCGPLTTTTAAQRTAAERVFVMLHSTACAPVTPAGGLKRLSALHAAPAVTTCSHTA